MKIALVLLAAFALIGSAAAWDFVDQVSYQRVLTGYEQAGNPLPEMIGAESGTYFKSKDVNNDVLAGAVFNKLAGTNQGFATAGTNTMGAEPWSQTHTLTQSGGAYVVSRALDTNDGPEIEAGISTYQNLHFSGAKFQGDYPNSGVFAQFESEGNAGVVNDWVVTSFTNLESASGRAQPGMIETSKADTFFTSADIGMASTAAMKVDEVTGAVFSGTVTSFAGFDGGRGTGVIEANAGGFENHVMVHNNGVWTQGFQNAVAWNTVPAAGYFPYW